MPSVTWERNLRYAREELERLVSSAIQARCEVLQTRMALADSQITSRALMARVDHILAGGVPAAS